MIAQSVRALLRTLGRSSHDQGVGENESYRNYIREIADGTGKSESCHTPRTDTAIIAIAELLRVAHGPVYIFGNSLPIEVFLSSMVRAAMVAFTKRNPHGRIVIVTSDPVFTKAAFASYSDHPLDAGRVDILPMPSELAQDIHLHFVLSDGREAPSYWCNRYQKGRHDDLSQGRVLFRDEEFAAPLRAIVTRAVTRYGV